MKIEPLSSKNSNLQTEAFYLFSLQGFGIPKFITFGHNKTYNILIEELLDKSLDFIFIKNNNKCTINDACLIAIQLIERFQWIHSKDIIYRDLKPENCLIGKEDPNIIYLIDFGLCKKYRSSKTGKHILPKRTGKFSGTMKYASFYALSGKEQSRRDDLISLGYMLIFLVKKNLPWNYDLNYIDKEKYEKLVKNKRNHGNGSLFYDVPKEFEEYIRYTYNLKFDQEPNYEYLKNIFKNLLFKTNLDIRNIRFKWINNKELTGFPIDKSKRKSNSQSRLMKELRENSTKRICIGKSQDIEFRNNNNKYNIKILPNSKTSLDLSKRDYNKKEDNNNNRNIKLKTLSNNLSLNDINKVHKRTDNTIQNEGIKNIYSINDNCSYNYNRNKIIKEKLNPIIFNDNNKENRNIIKIFKLFPFIK